MEGKPWTKGERLLTQARDTGRELALIFGYYERLENWQWRGRSWLKPMGKKNESPDTALPSYGEFGVGDESVKT